MIRPEIEEDTFIDIGDYKNLRKGIHGLYIIADKKRNPLYVRQTSDIRKRIEQHVQGLTNMEETESYFYLFRRLS